MHRHLAVDIGSESGRVFVGYIQDGKVYTEEIHRFKTQFMQFRDKSLRNIYRYHEEILHALKLYREKYGDTLESIGVDSWGGDFVLLNRDGSIAALPASYRATSVAKDAAEIIEEKMGTEEIYRHTGNQAMPTDTLSQILRLLRDGSPAMDDPRGILFMGDLYHYMLGAKPCCEHSLASYCRMYDNRKNCWDDEILERFGIPASIRTPVVYAGDVIGAVDPEILEQVGMKREVKIVTPCTHDTSCAALAVPDMGDDWIFISSGTWSLLGTETEAPVINDLACAYNLSNSTMPLRTNMLKKNIQGMWIIQQCRQAWGDLYSYEELVEQAEEIDDNRYYIDVDMEEFYAPKNMPKAIAEAVRRDFGAELDWEDVPRISRICFESLALKYRYYSDKLLAAADKKISKIYILGGGSYNRLVNQFTANAMGYPVYTGVYEGSNTANILLQAYGCGEVKDKEEMRRVICNTFKTHKFVPEDTELWDRKYDVFEHKISHNAQW